MSSPLFYEELGRLLYAIAFSDNTIDDGEREAVSRLITERLLHKEKDTDKFGTNEAWITRFSFETTEDSGMDAAEAMENFLDFSRTYRHEFSESDIELCIKLANNVADALRHINQRENKMLMQLSEALLEIKSNRPKP